MLSADTAFERCANAAAVAFAAAPPYVTYRVDARVVRTPAPSPAPRHAGRAPSPAPEASPSSIVRDVELRTRDGRALVRAAGAIAFAAGDPRPLAPVVDALADWGFVLRDTGGDVSLDVRYVRPHPYAEPSLAPGDAVVVANVNGFAISYAGDDPAHLTIAPATPALRAAAAEPDHFFYRDVWFDPATMLPTRVTLAAPGETFTLDYATVAGHWLLADFTYAAIDRTVHGPPLALTISATYRDYAFPPAVSGL